ncbi:RHS repeat-associated core domain-containing protein [Cysteiniphilum sp. 6C5]|uniref:RHS repeat-associated core domain-containing protein n=1 Tax=unclassified Cysteiniphilum TaxID=2610889 RepID=UPI003F844C82
MKSYLTNTIIVSTLAFLTLAGSVKNSFSQEVFIKNDSHTNLYYANNGKSNSLTLTKSNNDAAVAIQGTTDYQAYGVHPNTLNTNVATNFSYNDEYQDPNSNLVYLRARDYDANTQRFIAQDSANVWNKYNFADSNPIMNIDPSGHMPAWLNYTLNSLGVIVGIAGAVMSGGSSLEGAALAAANMARVSGIMGAASGAFGIAGQVVADTKADGEGTANILNNISFGLGVISMVADAVSIVSVANINDTNASESLLEGEDITAKLSSINPTEGYIYRDKSGLHKMLAFEHINDERKLLVANYKRAFRINGFINRNLKANTSMFEVKYMDKNYILARMDPIKKLNYDEVINVKNNINYIFINNLRPPPLRIVLPSRSELNCWQATDRLIKQSGDFRWR